MTRLGLVPLIAAAIAIAPPARADGAAPTTTLAGVQLAVAGGAGFAAAHRAVDVELQRTGWPTLPSVAPAGQVRMGLTAFDVSLDMNVGWSDLSLPGRDGAATGMEEHHGGIGAELGYLVRVRPWLTLSPYVGVGWISSTLCFVGRPDSTSAPSRPPFEQISRNPGRDTCLKASSAGLDVGLSLAWNLELGSSDDGALATYLSVGPRVGFGMPFSSARTWTPSASSSTNVVDLPAFQGPVAALGGAYAGLEIKFRFALEKIPPRAKAKGELPPDAKAKK